MTALEIVDLMIWEDAVVVRAVRSAREDIAHAVEAIAQRLRRDGRLFYVGAGTSGRLGVLDASECPPTFGTAPEQVVGVIAGGPEALHCSLEGAEDRAEDGVRALVERNVGKRDAVVGISASGRTPFVLGALRAARQAGALTIGLACNPDSAVAAAAELALTVVTGPEVLTGSTRLKAGTATKMVLNMLSTGAMVRLGRTIGNLMVDVNPACEKLEGRAARIVAELTGLDPQGAAQVWEDCGRDVRVAVVAACRGLDPEAARALLEAEGGDLDRAMLGESPQ